jgi:aryl-alcohol dehydrogenase-like predicted oxidoreductase
MGTDKEKTLVKLNALAALAKELGFTQAQLSLAWAIANKDVSTCILGFTRVSQVEENLKAMELYYKWNADIEKRVRDILANDPEAIIDFRKWAPLANRRDDHIAKA